jgi:hypothetical protein
MSQGMLKYSGKINCAVVVLAMAWLTTTQAHAASEPLQDLLGRTSEQVSKFLDQFSDVKCTEDVTQEKLKADGKVENREESKFDYLVILTNTNGELSLDESRLPLQVAKTSKSKNTSMLVSNGFATLFLIFHPYYAGSFEFTDLGAEVIGERAVEKVQFKHLRNTRSPAALALRGREFPLELSGTAWIDPKTAVIVKIEAGVEEGLEDIGMKAMRSQVEFGPVSFRNVAETYWFPLEASVEVETPRQHWRNTHHFSNYKKFSVDTEERVAQK